MSDQDQPTNPISEPTAPKPKPLSAKQKVFVAEYLKCWNAAEACRRAGYKAEANRYGHFLLTKRDIKAEIDRRLEEYAMEANEALYRLGEQARGLSSTILKLNDDGKFYVDNESIVKHGLEFMIKKIGGGYDKDHPQYIEFIDPQAALFRVLKTHGLLVDKTAYTNPDGTEEYGSHTAAERTRAITALADALRDLVPGTGDSRESSVDSAE